MQNVIVILALILAAIVGAATWTVMRVLEGASSRNRALMDLLQQQQRQHLDQLQVAQVASSEMVGRVAELVSDAVTSAIAATMPPVPSREDMVRQAAHEMASDPRLEDVDSDDPTDAFIVPPDRPGAEFVADDVDAPFGIPGVQFPSSDRPLSSPAPPPQSGFGFDPSVAKVVGLP